MFFWALGLEVMFPKYRSSSFGPLMDYCIFGAPEASYLGEGRAGPWWVNRGLETPRSWSPGLRGLLTVDYVREDG